MSGLELFWFTLSTLQVAFAAYAFAALASWRGERLWPTPGRPLLVLPAVLAGGLFALAVFTMLRVGDADLSRYVGTGALMLVAVTVFALLLVRGRSA